MSENGPTPGRAAPFRGIKRQSVRLTADDLIREHEWEEGQVLPLVIEPKSTGLVLGEWLTGKLELIEEKLLRHGAILFRNFDVASPAQFREIANVLYPQLLDYKDRAAPRVEVKKSIYTSTEFPADQRIPMHHEMSYSSSWPTRLFFYCEQPSPEGGRTPLTDDRKIIQQLPDRIKERFLEKNVMYVRNYGEGVDLPWREAFQTDDRAEVDRYCQQSGMEVEWRSADRLRTRLVRPPMISHSKTGDVVWFNHAHLFHVSSLPPEVRDALRQEFGEDELPRNALYGDGSSIEDGVLDEIRDLYERNAVRFYWQKGDVLLVDNVLVSHGREPFAGPRTILVAMAELFTPLA